MATFLPQNTGHNYLSSLYIVALVINNQNAFCSNTIDLQTLLKSLLKSLFFPILEYFYSLRIDLVYFFEFLRLKRLLWLLIKGLNIYIQVDTLCLAFSHNDRQWVLHGQLLLLIQLSVALSFLLLNLSFCPWLLFHFENWIWVDVLALLILWGEINIVFVFIKWECESEGWSFLFFWLEGYLAPKFINETFRDDQA